MGLPKAVASPSAKNPLGAQTLDDAAELSGERIDTGIPGLNRVFGKKRNDPGPWGLHRPSSVVLGGAHGCGKTTLLMMMLALMREPQKVLITTEQILSEVKSNLVDLGLGHYAGEIAAYSLLDEGNTLDAATAILDRIKPRVVVIDSVTELRNPKSDVRDRFSQMVAIIKYFKADAERHKRAIIMTAHLTKDSTVAGKSEQLHAVSTVMMFERYRHNQSLRVLHCPDKNRFGDTTEKAYFEMGSAGLTEVSPPSEANAPESATA
jgi:predicted ATP-dependent serine protease